MIDLEPLFALVSLEGVDEDAPLELDSLHVVTLVEEIERVFGVQMRSTDAARANFASKRAIRALVERKIATR